MTDYREKALAEFGAECRVCGATESIVVHHRDGDRSNNALENLVPLCETCHKKVHSRHPDVAELVRDLGRRPTSPGRTTIQVPDELADALYERKERGETYADVIHRLIEQPTAQVNGSTGGE